MQYILIEPIYTYLYSNLGTKLVYIELLHV